jgi:septal ring factor EnvC (AmiA/AmiB activator)
MSDTFNQFPPTVGEFPAPEALVTEAEVPEEEPKPKKDRRWLKRAGLVLAGAAVVAAPLGITLRSTMDERDTLTVDLADTEDDLAATEDDLDATEEEVGVLEADLTTAQDARDEARAERDAALADLSAVDSANASCQDAVVTMEEAFNARARQINHLTDAIQDSISLNVSAFGVALDEAQVASAEADRLYDEAVVAFSACV